ncbi:amino acid permease [Amnibacterium sp.]|uniref:amino acid permease n=1 Tax=Amnibacterium sp. TaxID=1872496 RepID=UPI002637401E|nr:amino acid permease [Amnibacterium sp.]MCU1472519.1 amino acid permease [Amnibacterium sp.]
MAGVALYVSAVIGPGILTLPAAAAQIAGPLSLVAVAALLVVSVPSAFAFVGIHRASTARAPTASIGLQRYATLAFGDLVGRIVAAWFYLGVPIGVPALALIGGSYVSVATGGGRPVTVAVAWAMAVLTIGIVLARGRSSGGLSLTLAIALVVLIIGAAAVSIPKWRPDRLGEIAPHGLLALVPAALTLAWVLMGWEASTNFTSMLRDPDRRLPRVIAISLAVVVVLYAAVAVPELLVLGPFSGSTAAPVAAMLRTALGAPASFVAAVLAVVLALAASVAYLTSFRELGRSLLPPTPRLSTSGRDRLALAIPALITGVGLLLATIAPLDASWFVRLCAGSQVPVYLVALASGLVLLRRPSRAWFLALIATFAVSVLLLSAGPYLLVPAVIAAIVVAGHRRRRRRAEAAGRGIADAGGAALAVADD